LPKGALLPGLLKKVQMQGGAPHAAPGGAILNVSSNVGRRGFRNRAPYVCSKWALHGLTQTLALELASCGIRVNAICPGPVLTERLQGSMRKMAAARGIPPAEVQKEWEAESPMGRFATAEECAQVALFLACADSSARRDRPSTSRPA
jgi:NAD(P)-dependent dehydrogenase (short-subunit alcohol dehydrogenase family)